MSTILHNSIKMTSAGLLAILIAQFIGLEHAITAGILAVLSIQKTRTDSVLIAGKRLIGALLALALSTVIFVLIGYNIWVFTLFTIIFISLSFGLRIAEGIVPSLVLVSHILNYGTFSFDPLFNGLALMLVALIVALGLNLIYPMNTKKHLKVHKDHMDRLIKEDLKIIAEIMNAPKNSTLLEKHESIEHTIHTILDKAQTLDKDLLFNKERPLIKYIRMRYTQLHRLSRLVELTKEITSDHPYMQNIADYIYNMHPDIGESDQASKQKTYLEEMLKDFRQKPLPTTREAFETRAVLYQMIFELEGFLNAKINYHQTT